LKIVIGNIIFFSALLLILARFLSVWAGTPFPIDLVTSDSMRPTLFEGDVVAWTPVKMEDIKVGDVIVFKSSLHWPDEKIVVHRVTKILKDDKGATILETKGDNNKRPDQEGGQIEPYIREDHLMGRTISVAQQPLKIPFVGYLGIWINQGLTSISQPTSTKESASFIGIFAPLTISAVVLVALIFVLPERAKTPKEKIHLNIFGNKPLNLKRTIIMFLVAYVVFLTVIHAFANDSMVASVGIDKGSPGQGLDFGRIQAGEESDPKSIPLINPGIMPVKGVVFGKGEIKDYVTKNIFQLNTGEIKDLNVKTVAPNGAQNGSYTGQIMVYSSPLWLMFPDEFIQNLVGWNAEATVFILDLLSAVILTSITLILLVSIAFIGDSLTTWTIDASWQRPSKIIIKRDKVKKIYAIKENIKRALGKNVAWIAREELAEEKDERTEKASFLKIIKPLIAALIVVPLLLLLEDSILAMLLAVIVSGLVAYFISCKLRNRIILTVLITMILATTYMVIQSNLTVISKTQDILELMALALGATSIYLLLFSVLIIPLVLISWAIIRFIRNLKERKDPLLALEGSCDL
jgi:signal peptidase I